MLRTVVNRCKEGHHGFACAKCRQNWSLAFFTSQCNLCQQNGQGTQLLIVVVLIFVLLVLVYFGTARPIFEPRERMLFAWLLATSCIVYLSPIVRLYQRLRERYHHASRTAQCCEQL